MGAYIMVPVNLNYSKKVRIPQDYTDNKRTFSIFLKTSMNLEF